MTIQKMQAPAFLAEAVWPKATWARDIVLVLGGSLLVALFAQLEIPMWPVPISGQTLAVLLVGALLGSKRGAASMLTYLGWGAIGLPIFSGGAAGPAVLLGTTGGYLAGFVVAAFVVGWLCERGWDRSILTAAAAMVIGNLVIYLCGVSWLAQFVGWEQVLAFGVLPFLVGDVIKIGLAALALPLGWRWIEGRQAE